MRINFTSTIDQNRLVLKLDPTENMIGLSQPLNWFTNFEHIPLRTNIELKKNEISISGKLNIQTCFVNKTDINSCIIYTAAINGDTLFGFAPRTEYSTDIQTLNGLCKNYQTTDANINICNLTNKPLKLKIFSGSLKLGNNRQTYLIDGNPIEKEFILNPIPYKIHGLLKEHKLNKIKIYDAINYPNKYKSYFKIIPDCPSIARLTIKLSSKIIDCGMIYDEKKKIHFKIEVDNKIIECIDGTFTYEIDNSINKKEHIFALIPICTKSSIGGKIAFDFYCYICSSTNNNKLYLNK